MSAEGWTLPGCPPEGGLGRGTFATVYRARWSGGAGDAPDVPPGTPVAVKALLIDASSVGEAGLRSRLTALQEVARHPHVADVLQVGVHAGRPYLVMPLHDATLADRTATGEPLLVPAAAAVIADVAAGLDHAHQRGLLHLNLHEGNILRTDQGRWTVADLGLATLVGVSATVDRAAAMGRPGWAPSRFAPELRAGRAFSAACDVYALAWIAHRLFGLDDPTVRVPRPVREVVERGMRATASERQRTAGGFAAELARAVGSGPMIGLAEVGEPSRSAPAGGIPAGRVPAGAMPAGPVPASAVPAGAMPAGAMPAGAMPAGAMPAGAMPAGPVPASARPGAMPSGRGPVDRAVGPVAGSMFDPGPVRPAMPGPVTQALSVPPPPRARRTRPHPVAIAVATTALVLVAGLALWSLLAG